MQLGKKLIQCLPGINNIFHYYHITSKNILVQSYGGYDITARLHSLIRSQFDKTDLSINCQVLEEVRSKHEGTIQYGNKQRPFILVVFIDRFCYLPDLFLYFF